MNDAATFVILEVIDIGRMSLSKESGGISLGIRTTLSVFH